VLLSSLGVVFGASELLIELMVSHAKCVVSQLLQLVMCSVGQLLQLQLMQVMQRRTSPLL
jgi:hypothetical protein